MPQHYSNPDRAKEPHSLPDVETFYLTSDEANGYSRSGEPDDDRRMRSGWYYHYCFPGCLPDSEPYGPYKSEAEALEVAREDASDRCPQCNMAKTQGCEPQCEESERVEVATSNARACVED